MAEYRIVTDSSCDLPQSLADELELVVTPLAFYNEENQEFRNYLDWREIGVHDFYESLRQGSAYKTSAVNMDGFLSAMEPILESGEDILYVAFSSGLSSSYATAVTAAEELSEKYPDRKIYVVDSLSASLGQGLLLYHTVQQKRSGKTIEEVRDYVETTRMHLCHWFTVDDLMFLKRGGRVSTATALVGTMLGIKPVMHMDNEGHLVAVDKTRGRKASIKALLNQAGKLGVNLENQVIYICHGDCEDDANYAAELFRSMYNVRDVLVHPVGPVIGSHTGPGVLSVFYLGTER